MNCNTTHYRANSSSVPGDPTFEQPLQRLEAKLVQKQNSAITQETVQSLAAEAAEAAVAEWAAAKLPKLIAEAVRVGVAANATQQATREASREEVRPPAAATQQRANQLIQELQQKMLSFSAEMERLVDPQAAALSAANSARQVATERSNKARSAALFGDSDLDGEISAALDKLLGKP